MCQSCLFLTPAKFLASIYPTMDGCLFCKIIGKELPTTIRYEDDHVVAFNDIHPSAPFHVVIVPKKHIVGIETIGEEDGPWLTAMLRTVRTLIEEAHLYGQFKLIANGPALRHVEHLHFHLLSGSNIKNLKGNLP